MRLIAALLWLGVAAVAHAGELNRERALFNYQMFCQGCHTPDGSGANAVPQMKGHVGYFMATPRGREYLVRVPGSATSALDDEQLAEVLNWIILEFAGDSAGGDYEPYTAAEVRQLRQSPLNEVVTYRAHLLAEIAAAKTRE